MVEQWKEDDFDPDSRWALAWFEQYGYEVGAYGVAEILSQAKAVSLDGLERGHVIQKSRGKVRLLRPEELPQSWDPTTVECLTAWETVHQLIRTFEDLGEAAVAPYVAKLGAKAEIARELCYRLYTICKRRKRAHDARSYDALVQLLVL